MLMHSWSGHKHIILSNKIPQSILQCTKISCKLVYSLVKSENTLLWFVSVKCHAYNSTEGFIALKNILQNTTYYSSGTFPVIVTERKQGISYLVINNIKSK